MRLTLKNPASANLYSKDDLYHHNPKEEIKMRKCMKNFVVMFLAVMMIVMFV